MGKINKKSKFSVSKKGKTEMSSSPVGLSCSNSPILTCNNVAQIVQNVILSDEEEFDPNSGLGETTNHSKFYERRREAHSQAEQKRRDAIRKGYNYLKSLIPSCSTAAEATEQYKGNNLSKAVILQRSIEYIQGIQLEMKEQESLLSLLRKEVRALQIIKNQCEGLTKSYQTFKTNNNHLQVPIELKFQAFRMIMDSLYDSFKAAVKFKSFEELSRSTLVWLEEYCQPQLLQELLFLILQRIKTPQSVELSNSKHI